MMSGSCVTRCRRGLRTTPLGTRVSWRKKSLRRAPRDGRASFTAHVELPVRVVQAIRWQAEREPNVVMAEREAMIQQLVLADSELRASGWCQRWHADSDEVTKGVCSEVNGHLFAELLRAAGHKDVGCANLFREGAVLAAAVVAPPCAFADCRCKNAWQT